MILVTADEMREMDRLTIEDIGIPGRVLMENAGRGAFDFFRERFPEAAQKKVGILAGGGNNGGDGFVMARLLVHEEIDGHVFLFSNRERLKGDAKANLEILFRLGISVTEIPDLHAFEKAKKNLGQMDMWIDALLGTGLKSEVSGLLKKTIEFVNRSQKPAFSVDIPSGLDSDTGHPKGVCIRAAATATFGHAKIGSAIFPGIDYTGILKIIDIGIPPKISAQVAPKQHLLTPETLRSFIRKRASETHKGQTGHVLVIGGSAGKTGASVMTATAAMRTGAGLVTLGIPESLHSIVASQVVEVMTASLPETAPGIFSESALKTVQDLLHGKACLALGPGIGSSEETIHLVLELIRTCPVPMVIDADGLNCLARSMDVLRERKSDIVLTPHPGEMARITGLPSTAIQKDRVGSARRLAIEYGITVVLKGARTIIAERDTTVHVNPTGNPGMASGGMGDILTGMIAGWIAQGLRPEDAAKAGVYLHGAAADKLFFSRGSYGYLASDVMSLLPAQIRETTFL